MSRKVDYDFIVEYAKSDRSKCGTSKETIPKGAIRVGQMVQSPKFDGKYPQWHSLKYFFAKGNRGLTKWEMLHGRDTLRFDDQEKVKKLILKHNGGEEEKGVKRKADGDAEGESDTKKAKKEETPEEKALREESEEMWKIRDAIDTLETKDLKDMLEANGQSEKGGRPDLLSRIVEGMMFGIVKKCDTEKCKGGHVYYDKSTGKYRCSGRPSEWATCLMEADPKDVKISKYKLPDWYEEDPFLAKWKFVARKRAAVKSEIVRAEVSEDFAMEEEKIKAAQLKRPFFQVGKANTTPFTGYTIGFAGKLSEKQADLDKLVIQLGGKVSKNVTPSLTHLISNESEVKKESTKIEQAITYDIPIMNEDWLQESAEREEFLNQKDYLIGGSSAAKSKLKRDFTDPAEEEKVKQAAEAGEKKMKLVMKGRCAVDPAAGEKVQAKFHVLDHGKTEIYNVVLNLTDITAGLNSYYGMQLLEADDKRKQSFKVFRKWGRVGVSKVGGTKIEKFESKRGAIASFREVYLDKTGNSWDDRDSFKKQPGKFFPIEIDYSGLDKKKDAPADLKSKLEAPVQNLVSLIFDIKVMEQSLAEMEIDLKKMPLGNLSKKHIESGYAVLTEIDGVLKGSLNERQKAGKLLELTNKFYTLIPHDFGTKDPTIISSQEQLDVKMKLMEALIDIEIAATFMKQDGVEGESPIDTNYKKLKTELVALKKEDEEFQMALKYLTNQKGSYRVELLDCFKVAREGESERFDTAKEMGSRTLLWHGSRVSNYVGILSQGLRIAPPEAPKSGYRFGKGIYFADLCEKSIGYCRGAGSDYILMMLVEVSLGKIKELYADQYMEQALPGSNSTKAMGSIAPNPKDDYTLPSGCRVPLGKAMNTGVKSSCIHNEYIIYTLPQATIRYLLKIKVNDK